MGKYEFPPVQPDAQFLARFAEAWNRHDIDALMGFMADECEFHAVAGPDLMGRSFVGREAVRDGFQMAWQAFPMPPGWMESTLCAAHAASRVHVQGRTKADGLCVSTHGGRFTFRDGKIAVKNAYRKTGLPRQRPDRRSALSNSIFLRPEPLHPASIFKQITERTRAACMRRRLKDIQKKLWRLALT
ncbi:nuclear transport factor 2 family protein [Staphylococcus epidermidis]|nr:nuclear transport factor 2 family protein [Staphylococcus epidermidis]